jgi:hypothetical protein
LRVVRCAIQLVATHRLDRRADVVGTHNRKLRSKVVKTISNADENLCAGMGI